MTKTSKTWEARVLTLFPNMFPGILGDAAAGRGIENGLWSLKTINIRDFATDQHGTVDDQPFGGGPGMVMRADILASAIDKVHPKDLDFLEFLSKKNKEIQPEKSEEFPNISNDYELVFSLLSNNIQL